MKRVLEGGGERRVGRGVRMKGRGERGRGMHFPLHKGTDGSGERTWKVSKCLHGDESVSDLRIVCKVRSHETSP